MAHVLMSVTYCNRLYLNKYFFWQYLTIIRWRRGDYRGNDSWRRSRREYSPKITEPEANNCFDILHIQVNTRNHGLSLYTKVIFLREIICSSKMHVIYVIVKYYLFLKGNNYNIYHEKVLLKFCWVFRVF